LRRAIDHAFGDEADGGLGLSRLQVLAGDGNAASHRVARSSGFTETGRDRRCYLLGDGRVVDMVRFDLLRAEWPLRQDPTSVGL
jgi:RimJ/RimL family protein N-acetyltransferase